MLTVQYVRNRMMQKLLILICLPLFLLVTSCTSTDSTKKDPDPETLQYVDPKVKYKSDLAYLQNPVVFTDTALKDSLVVSYIEGYNDENERRVQINVKNKTMRSVSASYRLEWFDANGFMMLQSKTKRIVVPGNDYYFIKIDTTPLDGDVEEHQPKVGEAKDKTIADHARIVFSR